MSVPKIVSQGEWVAAREALLVKEKEATKQRDRLNAERRELPMDVWGLALAEAGFAFPWLVLGGPSH